MPGEKISIVVLDGTQAQQRWPEIRELIKREFDSSQFNDGCDIWRPLESTQEAMDPPERQFYRHVVALDEDDKMVGGWFRIPCRRTGGETCSPGWFLSARELGSMRSAVADLLVVKAHDVMRSGGFTRIVTNMGTAAGTGFLQRRHGYVHQPTAEKNNTWSRVL